MLNYEDNDTSMAGVANLLRVLCCHCLDMSEGDSGVEAKTAPPETCRAIWLVGHGGYDKLEVRDTEVKAPGDDEVRIAVQAWSVVALSDCQSLCIDHPVAVCSGLNFSELMMRQGLYKRAGNPPFILGIECSGTVEALGDNVKDLKVMNSQHSARHNDVTRTHTHTQFSLLV